MNLRAISVPTIAKLAPAAAIAALTLPALAACGSEQAPDLNFDTRFGANPQIVSGSFEYPRMLTSPAGDISIPAEPQRILTLSVGHDEMVLALLENRTERLAGVSSSTHGFSNVGHLVAELTPVGKDVEQIASIAPDIVILDRFTQPEFVAQLNSLGVPVFQTELDDRDFNVPNILALGYLLGQEEQAVTLAESVEQRLDAAADVLAEAPPVRAIIASKYDSIWVSGSGSTGGNVLDAAGIVNAAHEVPANNGFVSIEAIAEFNPEVIFVSGGGDDFVSELTEHPILQTVPAIANGELHQVTSSYYGSLSHWVVCGVEEVAQLARNGTAELGDECESGTAG